MERSWEGQKRPETHSQGPIRTEGRGCALLLGTGSARPLGGASERHSHSPTSGVSGGEDTITDHRDLPSTALRAPSESPRFKPLVLTVRPYVLQYLVPHASVGCRDLVRGFPVLQGLWGLTERHQEAPHACSAPVAPDRGA